MQMGGSALILKGGTGRPNGLRDAEKPSFNHYTIVDPTDRPTDGWTDGKKLQPPIETSIHRRG
jgi:hypothetical protein